MKIQTILFALLQAQTVLSAIQPQRQTSLADSDCSLPCKTTKLRLSSSKMEECLAANCGDHDVDEAMVITAEAEVSYNHTSCVSRCNRLRFGRTKKAQCIDDCDEEYPSNARSVEPDEVSGNHTSCVTRCNRFQFRLSKKAKCIADCDEKYEPSDERSAEPNEDVAKCEAVCRKLRFSPEKQASCIQDCQVDDIGSEDEADEKAVIIDEAESPDGNHTSCVGICNRLRFGAIKKAQCIADCDEEYPQERTAKTDNVVKCEAVCRRLRFSPEKQASCIEDCQVDDIGSEDEAVYEEKDKSNLGTHDVDASYAMIS